MSRSKWINLAAIILLVGGLLAAIGLSVYYANLPKYLAQHETLVLGQTTFTPGSDASLRVVVRDTASGAPLEGAQISISLRARSGEVIPLYLSETNSQGTANVAFKVPETKTPEQTLIVETRSKLGADKVERAVTIQRDYRVLLTTDKPLYQPGQVMHVRALALGALDLLPARDLPLEVTIADGKGNKVFRQTVQTSAYGAAAYDFTLASEVNTGAYKVTARLGNTSSEKTVTVENYVLPKFSVKLTPEKTFYMPAETVRGQLQASYFFGKPVASAKVNIEGYTFDVQRNVSVKIDGKTDEQGNYSFEFTLPAYLTGTELDKGSGRFYLQAEVTDGTEHTERVNTSLPVSRSPLVIEAIPESGQFRPGVPNSFFVLVSYPDGSPADGTATVTFREANASQTIALGKYGVATFTYTPRSPYQAVQVVARDTRGNTLSRDFNFQGTSSQESVLLHPEQPIYQVGEPMLLHIYTSQPTGTVYLDIVRENQTVSTRAVEVQNGQATVTVDLTPDLYGTLELHAYKILRTGAITRDTRLVVVDQAEGLKIRLAAGQDTYRPGDQGQLGITVTGSDGKGAQSAIGLAIVDESVFALAEQDPGFARLYFMLEKQLLQPKYDLHGYSLPELLGGAIPPDNPELRAAVGVAAQASLAEAVKAPVTFALQANSHQDNLKKANQMKASFFSGLGTVSGVLVAVAALAMAVLTGWSLRRQKVLGRSLLLTLAILVILVLIVAIWPLERNALATSAFASRLLYSVQAIFNNLPWLAWLALAAVIGLIILIIIAARRKDGLLGWLLALIPIYLGLLILLAYAFNQSTSSGPPTFLIWVLLAGILLAPLAYLLCSAGFFWQRRILAAIAALPVAAALLVGFIPLMLISSGSTSPLMGRDVVQFAAMENMAGAVPLAAMPTPAPSAIKSAESVNDRSAQSAAEPPRLRQYFPETLLWLPDAVTDANGVLNLNVPIADSITTWRITALASTQDGRLGSATGPLRVFQDFFIDLDLPLSLTVGDEISVPVGVFNYLDTEQTVKLELAKADWFELKDQPVKEIKIASNEISVVYFRIKARTFGQQPFQVTAWGSKMSDAIKKDVTVYPDGKQIRATQSDRLSAGKPAAVQVKIPAEAIPGTQRLWVKIYPGMLSQVVEGLDSILRMPNGCFEQTSSATYPNVLVLDYLKVTSQASPEVQMKAEQYINLGYQRLATFEVKSSGGFSLFGNEPADRMLTAYGLQEFSDMSRVHEVDPALLKRAAQWLISQQESDGSWKNDRGLVHESTWQQLGNDRLPVTAYIVWSLTDAGFGNEAGTKKGLDYVREFQSQAKDPYALALVVNALVAADLKSGTKLSSPTLDALNRLAGLAQRDGDKVFWTSGVASFMGSKGLTGSIETTALAALAFQRSGEQPDLANGALAYLVQQKDSFGTWHNTQATVLTLKALIQSVRGGGEKVDASVTVTLNGGQAKTVRVTPQNFDVVQLLSFEDVNPGRDNRVEIKAEGQGNLMYQVASSYYLPWPVLDQYPDLVPPQEDVTIDVKYDRTQIAVNDTVNVTVTVRLNQKGARAESALVDLGLPPGFTVMSEDLTAVVQSFQGKGKSYTGPAVQRYDLTGRQILVYLSNLAEGQPITFSYRLRARFPLSVRTPASSAYDYYNPAVSGEKAPQGIEVKQ